MPSHSGVFRTRASQFLQNSLFGSRTPNPLCPDPYELVRANVYCFQSIMNGIYKPNSRISLLSVSGTVQKHLQDFPSGCTTRLAIPKQHERLHRLLFCLVQCFVNKSSVPHCSGAARRPSVPFSMRFNHSFR